MALSVPFSFRNGARIIRIYKTQAEGFGGSFFFFLLRSLISPHAQCCPPTPPCSEIGRHVVLSDQIHNQDTWVEVGLWGTVPALGIKYDLVAGVLLLACIKSLSLVML